MGMRGDLPPGRSGALECCQGTRSDAIGVDRAKVQVKALNFPSPVSWHEWQGPLRTVAHSPTGINLRMTEGLANRFGQRCPHPEDKRADCVRSVYLDLAVGQPSGDIGHHLP